MHLVCQPKIPTVRRRDSWFRRHILWGLYACLWNACSKLSPHQQMLRDIIKHAVPGGIPLNVLYLNYGTGDFEELLDRERGFARVISINRFPHCAALVRRRRRINSSRGSAFYQSFRKPLAVMTGSQNVVICMGRPSGPLQLEIDRVCDPNRSIVVYVAPKAGINMWPMIKEHLENAWALPSPILRIRMLIQALPAFLLFLLQLAFGLTPLFSMMRLEGDEDTSQEYSTCVNLMVVRTYDLQAKAA